MGSSFIHLIRTDSNVFFLIAEQHFRASVGTIIFLQANLVICIYSHGLPWWLSWERVHLQCRRPGFNPWVEKIPWRRERLPTVVFLPEEPAGYSPWGGKESDMTEQLSLSYICEIYIYIYIFFFYTDIYN